MSHMRRREVITLLGGAAAWPLPASAQQSIPTIGFLHSQSPEALADALRGFRQGLKEAGYSEGENVAIEYRWAEDQLDRLPALAGDLVRKGVAVIVAGGGSATARVANAVTTAIPVVFNMGDDPVKLGLVPSLSRPGGNLTGVNWFAVELAAKRLELLRELVPGAARVAVLVNPANPASSEPIVHDAQTAARAMGLQIQVLKATSSKERRQDRIVWLRSFACCLQNGLEAVDEDEAAVAAPKKTSTPRILSRAKKKTPMKRRREIIAPASETPQDRRPMRADTRATLVASMARGCRWLDEMIAGNVSSVEQIAARDKCSVRQVNMTISLAFLAPQLVQAAVEGRLPRSIGVTRPRDAPAEWSRQYAMLGLSH